MKPLAPQTLPTLSESSYARRSPILGVREVVGARFDAPPLRVDVRALMVGTRIDTRTLTDLVEPDRMASKGLGALFVFRSGVIVLIGATPAYERRLLARLEEHITDPLPIPEIETATIELKPDREEQVNAHGDILLREPTVERLLLVATVLARSVVLARDEIRIAEAFDRIEPLVSGLQVTGRAGLPIKRVMQHIGDVLAARNRVAGRTQISEKPDILWDYPELDRLYSRLEAEYELGDRARVIERKLEVIGDSADVLLNLVQDKRSVRLELAIIGLIMFEIALSLYEMAHQAM